MTRFTRLEVLNAVVDAGLVPVFYHADAAVARNVARAVAAGGCRLLEFTNRGDFAPDVFRDLSINCRDELPTMMLGVGSVVDASTAALYIAHGASFVVSPNFDADVARLCNRRKIPYFPGCGSVTEIARAEELGVEIVKVFPGDAVGGPEFVKAVLGPCPWTRIMVTGGVEATQESIQRWFRAGATAVGIGSHLLRKEWIQAGDWGAISARTAELLGWIRAART